MLARNIMLRSVRTWVDALDRTQRIRLDLDWAAVGRVRRRLVFLEESRHPQPCVVGKWQCKVATPLYSPSSCLSQKWSIVKLSAQAWRSGLLPSNGIVHRTDRKVIHGGWPFQCIALGFNAWQHGGALLLVAAACDVAKRTAGRSVSTWKRPCQCRLLTLQLAPRHRARHIARAPW